MVIKASSYDETSFMVAGRLTPWADETMLMLTRVRRPEFNVLSETVKSRSEYIDIMA